MNYVFVYTARQSLSGRHSLSNSQTTHDSQGQPFKLGSEKSTVDYSGDFGETKTFKFDKVLGKFFCNSFHTYFLTFSLLQESHFISYMHIQVFDSTTTQVEVFEEVKGVVDSVMSGFNGTVMAYGQTSAGILF